MSLARILFLSLALLAPSRAAERVFDFGEYQAGERPKGFRSAVSGGGPLGDWQVLYEDVRPEGPGAAPSSSVTARRAVLAQVSRDPTDERFPLLLYEPEKYGDFTLTTRFKTVDGKVEQMAGLAFRVQDERNYYVVRASSLGGTFVFYKFVDGVRSPPIGVSVDIPRGVWHALTVECKGNQIRCRFNGQELLPTLTDNSFAEGQIGFWTKSDAVSYFTDTRLSYTPREMLARVLVREVMEHYPRLAGVKIYAQPAPNAELQVVASNNPADVGRPAGKADRDTVARGVMYYGKTKKQAEVLFPLRDRNGDPVAAVRVVLERFPGQTEANAIARAKPIANYVQQRIRNADDLTR
jgi:hypothetical protein